MDYIEKDNPNLVKISLGAVLYILSDFITKYPYDLILVIVSFSIFSLILLEAFLVYMKKTHKKSRKLFGAILGGIVIIVVSIILSFLIGIGTAFWVSVTTFIVMYAVALINLFCSNGKEEKKSKNKK